MIRLTVRTLALLAASVLIAQSRADEQLPSDDRVKTGQLDNGVTWMYRQHDNPPGKMALMINIDTGSLNETEEQRGLAHFLEHMSFNGSENFPPGELIEYFESIGMVFGEDVNAFTSFDQTAYMVFLPGTSPEEVDTGLMVLSDCAFRLSLLEEEIEKERGVILSELRAGMSARQRVRDQFIEQVFEGTRISQRIPIGLEEVIRNATRDDFEAYYRAWYRPERATLMIVGDAAPEPYLPLIEKWFGPYAAPLPAQPEQGPEFKPFTAERAIIISDPEYSRGDVDLYNVRPGRPATTTVELARAELIEGLGSWIMGRRFSERIKQGTASYRSAGAGVSNFMHDAILVNASAKGEPKDWEQMLEEVIVEVSRAREHGFTPRELELAKTEFIANSERDVRTESTRNARRIVRRMNRAVSAGEPILSAQQELDLLNRVLPTITLEEVSAAFAENFKPGTFAYMLTMPEKDDVALPSSDDVLAVARAAQARRTEAPREEQRQTELLPRLPAPGKLVESEFDEDLAITSGWLSNGVRLHHRFMDYKKDTVLLSITLAGGEIEETAENAGVTTIATLAIDQPATSRLSSTEIADILTGKNIRVGVTAQGDAFTVTVTGSPKDLETGLQLAHALLTDGKIEQSAFDHWKQGALQQYEMFSKMPQGAAVEALLDTISGGDPRRTIMSPAKIEAQSVARGQAWLERLCRAAPIEVAVVGELTLEEVRPLVERYIGSLPQRSRTAAHLDPLRKNQRGPGPYERNVSVETITPQAMVFCGFIGCDVQNVADVRALNLAANTLDSRVLKRVREELGLVYSIGATNRPSQAYENAGLFYSAAPCAPDKGNEVVQEVTALFQAFADTGPTAAELDNAKKQTKNNLDTQLQEPRYWFMVLRTLDLHKLKLDDLKHIEEAYLALTAEQVRDVFRKYHTPTRLVQIVATPAEAKIPAAATR